MNKKIKGLLSGAYLVFILVVILIPIISVVVFSFNGADGRYASLTRWKHFSFEWYTKLFTDHNIQRAIFVTFFVGIIATVVSVIIGTLAAYSLSKAKKRTRTIVMNLTNVPIVTPEIIVAMSLLIVFASVKISTGLLSLILAHISFCTPYVVITVYPKALEIDSQVIDAAADLGATPGKILRKVVLPQLKTGIIAGAIIAFSMSFDDFIISYFVGGNYQNLSTYIYTLKGTINPTINALSTVILMFIAGKIMFDYFFKNKKKKIEED